MARKLGDLVEALPHAEGAVDGEIRITGVYDDSRRVQQGGLFVAYRGVEQDGHRFIPDAIARGAAVVVGERPLTLDVPYIQVRDGREALAYLAAAWHGFPAEKLTLVGVTGTDGKTTTATLLHSILQASGRHTGLISTVEAVLGSEKMPTGLHTTTPPALEVQALLAKMVENGVETVVLEVTSHGLAQHRLDGCAFDAAVVTNVTHEHLDFHRTDREYVAAKRRLFLMLRTGGLAVLNRDDRSYDLFRPLPEAHVVTYGLEHLADVTSKAVKWDQSGMELSIRTPKGELPIRSPLIGQFNVYNILAAVAVAWGMGVDTQAIRDGVAAMKGVPGRMETVDRGQPFTAMVDFAHTPNALKRALEAARTMTKGRIIVVFGSAGERDREKRRMMGEVAGRFADLVVVTAEDPRREPLEKIMEEIAQGCVGAGKTKEECFLVPDRGEAIEKACRIARPGDLVMVCGKGHEQSMCFGTTEYPWDDRVALAAVLEGLEAPWLPTSDRPPDSRL